ncbi:hypothetical protein OOZ15_19985, partial [Galbibacter sp. EGI 63066]|uniref:hypothetical protein n=1 Tax=Galbibacter sp. EGI 63066 TaxID=2993559 RepID=UPI0022494B7C
GTRVRGGLRHALHPHYARGIIIYCQGQIDGLRGLPGGECAAVEVKRILGFGGHKGGQVIP